MNKYYKKSFCFYFFTLAFWLRTTELDMMTKERTGYIKEGKKKMKGKEEEEIKTKQKGLVLLQGLRN
jgi:hypothetical protein